MNFLTKQFTLDEYYNMIQNVYNKLGNTYYKGLNNKYPPIRLNNNNMVSLAHPKDFLKEVNIFKEFFKKSDQTLNIDDVKDNIYEIYPSIDNLKQEPNGFIALFVSESYKGYVFKHFRSNNEINTIRFIKIDDVVNCTSILQNFITFVKLKQNMYLKFKDLYLVVGETNNLDILNGIYNTTGIYTLFGGKRKYNESTIDGTIREFKEELGLSEDSSLYKRISTYVKTSKYIVKCNTYNIYCVSFY